MGNKLLILFLLLTIASLSTSYIFTQRMRNRPQTNYSCTWFGYCSVTKRENPSIEDARIEDLRIEEPRIEEPRIEEPRGRDADSRYRIMRFF